MEEMLIIPRAEAPALLAKHSAKLLEDGRMTQAARLAAQQERILKDPLLADDEAVQRVKPVSRRLRRAVRKLRQLDTQPLTATEQEAQDQELVTPAFTKWMQRMIRQPKKEAPPKKIKTEPPSANFGLISPPLKRPAPVTPPPKKKKKAPAAPPQTSTGTRRRKQAVPKKLRPREETTAAPPPTGARKRKQKKPKRLRRPRLSEDTKEKISGGVGQALKKSLSKSWKKW